MDPLSFCPLFVPSQVSVSSHGHIEANTNSHSNRKIHLLLSQWLHLRSRSIETCYQFLDWSDPMMSERSACSPRPTLRRLWNFWPIVSVR